MNGRAITAEITALLANALWVYGGTALAVAALGDGASMSIWAALAVVGLSYGLARLLQGFDISEGALRFWGVGLSVLLLYVVCRADIAGDLYLWRLGWLGDLLASPGSTLEGHGGDVTEVILLGAAWAWGVTRGIRDFAFESLLGDIGLGLVVVLLAAAFGPAADAAGTLRWLPVPFMVAGLLALALAHLGSVEADRRRPFLGVWMSWTGGSLGVIAGLALLAAAWNPPSMEAVGRAALLAGEGVALALAYAVAPFLYAVAWVIQHVIDWLAGSREALPPAEMTPPAGLPEGLTEADKGEPAHWTKVIGYVLRSGLVVLAIALALTVLWFAFRRFSRGRGDEIEVREEASPGEGGPLGDLRSMLSGALAGLRRRATGESRGRDALGRLYFSVLRRAAGEGLPRPPAATPLEFAPRLEEHFVSSVPGAISQAYSEARYGRQPRPRHEVERLSSQWEKGEKDRRRSP